MYSQYRRLTAHCPQTPVELGHRHLSYDRVTELFDGRFITQTKRYSGCAEPILLWLQVIAERILRVPPCAGSALNRVRAWEGGIPYPEYFVYNLQLVAVAV